MARVHITHRVDHAALQALLTSPQGGVARDLLRRGLKVESAAKRNLNRSPRRVNTGRLRGSIHAQLVTGGTQRLGVRVGTNVSYAGYVHDGTGLYGPRGGLIYPKSKKALRWPAVNAKGKKVKGKYVFARYTRGMPRNQFLKDALPAARG